MSTGDFSGLQAADREFQYATGYLIEQEDHASLMASAQSPNQFTFGRVDPRTITPMHVEKYLKLENQLRLSSCAGTSASTILELCLWLQSGGVSTEQLSKMMAYINGQHYCGITGDNGATLEGVIKGLMGDGLAAERFMPYTGQYYTSIPQAAREDAKQRKLKSYAPIRTIQEAYEAIAHRVGGIFLGIPCTDEIFNPGPRGRIEVYTPQRVGGHAIGIVDVCDTKDENGYPYFKSPGSWGPQYGDNGYTEIRPSAFMSMLQCSLTSCYVLSEMEFIKPRYDWERQTWAA